MGAPRDAQRRRDEGTTENCDDQLQMLRYALRQRRRSLGTRERLWQEIINFRNLRILIFFEEIDFVKYNFEDSLVCSNTLRKVKVLYVRFKITLKDQDRSKYLKKMDTDSSTQKLIGQSSACSLSELELLSWFKYTSLKIRVLLTEELMGGLWTLPEWQGSTGLKTGDTLWSCGVETVLETGSARGDELSSGWAGVSSERMAESSASTLGSVFGR